MNICKRVTLQTFIAFLYELRRGNHKAYETVRGGEKSTSDSTKTGVEARSVESWAKGVNGNQGTEPYKWKEQRVPVLVNKSVGKTYSTCNIRLLLVESTISFKDALAKREKRRGLKHPSIQNYTIPFTNIPSNLQYSGTMAA